jgi:transcriptional regulator with XRE-family HTH domain
MTPQEFKARRTNLGFSQSALAERLGVTKQTIINYEREGGEGPPAMAALAMSALGGPVGPLSEIAVKGALIAFLDSVLGLRDADAAASNLNAYEDMFARVRPMEMAYDESTRRARVFAFERLIEAIDKHGAPPRGVLPSIDDDLLAAIMRPALAPARGIGTMPSYEHSQPPLLGGLSRLGASKMKPKP